MHPALQTEYFDWIANCIKDRSAIGPFCDWLDENGIRSQQWKEVFAFMGKVKYVKLVERKDFLWCSMVTAHKIIDLKLVGKTTIYIGIRNRSNTLTNKMLETGLSIVDRWKYQKV